MKKLIITPKNPNGKIVDLSAEEITQRNNDIAKDTEIKNAEQTAKTNTETRKASGKQKLLDLGLTEEEVKALIGV